MNIDTREMCRYLGVRNWLYFNAHEFGSSLVRFDTLTLDVERYDELAKEFIPHLEYDKHNRCWYYECLQYHYGRDWHG